MTEILTTSTTTTTTTNTTTTLSQGKFLKITGRIKEQYKLENGKYVVPAPLEGRS